MLDDKEAAGKSPPTRRRTSVEVVPKADQPILSKVSDAGAAAYVKNHPSLFSRPTGNTQLMAYYASLGPLALAAVDALMFPATSAPAAPTNVDGAWEDSGDDMVEDRHPRAGSTELGFASEPEEEDEEEEEEEDNEEVD